MYSSFTKSLEIGQRLDYLWQHIGVGLFLTVALLMIIRGFSVMNTALIGSGEWLTMAIGMLYIMVPGFYRQVNPVLLLAFGVLSLAVSLYLWPHTGYLQVMGYGLVGAYVPAACWLAVRHYRKRI